MMDFKKMAAAFAAGGAILAAGAAYSLNHKKQCEYPSGGLSSFKSPLGRIII